MRIPVLALALTLSVAAHAQNAPQPGQGQGQWQGGDHFRGGHHGPNAEFEAKMLTRRLNLTPDQTAALTPILTSQQEQFKALKPAPGTTPDYAALRQQREQIMSQTNQSIEAILTPEQKTAFEAMHNHKGHGPHGDHQPATSTPSA
jgi:Spy/CpxP family protein refolding chaperone